MRAARHPKPMPGAPVAYPLSDPTMQPPLTPFVAGEAPCAPDLVGAQATGRSNADGAP